MLTLFCDVKWPRLGRYLLDLFIFNKLSVNMNLWKWSYCCLNHNGICSFFRKLKTSFLSVQTHCSGKPDWFSHWMSLFTCMSAPWLGPGWCDSLKWVCLRAVRFWEVLSASVHFMNHLLLDRHACSAFQPLIGTYQNSNIEIPGHEPLVLERACYLKATTTCGDIFVVAW